jgi:hypothetical protein
MKWIKPADCESAHCIEVAECESGACLEVAEAEGGNHLLMRATELATGPEILVSRKELAAFLVAAKAGQYDHLV